MFHRLAVRLTLACYSVIALMGQGLHLWTHDYDDHDCPGCDECIQTCYCEADAVGRTDMGSPCDDSSHHDSEHCSICQHQALGQIFVATPPAEILLAVCELLSPPAPEAVVCPAPFSVAQPRAPPAAV